MCAMSVAFDDQGEIVPRRGTTSSVRPAAPAAGFPPHPTAGGRR